MCPWQPAWVAQAGEGLTALRFDDSGLHCAVGTSNGLVALFDLRSSRPVLVKDHLYSSSIVDLKFHSEPGSAGARVTPPRSLRKCQDARLPIPAAPLCRPGREEHCER